MKNPGPITFGTEDHEAVLEFSKFIAKRFGLTDAAALGQVLKFDEALQKVTESETGMAALKITVDKDLR